MAQFSEMRPWAQGMIFTALGVAITSALFAAERVLEFGSGRFSTEFALFTLALLSFAGSWLLGSGLVHFVALRRQRIAGRFVDEVLAGELLRVVYQPVVSAANGTIRRAEALLRFERDGKVHGPADLLKAAEISRRQPQVTDAVLRTIERDYGDYDFGIPVTVNLTAPELEDHRLVERLARRDCPIDVEVVETAFAGGNSTILAALHRLRAAGARVYLDDFGTGYSSLAHFAELPVDVIKIDRTFVSMASDCEKHLAICKAVVDLAAIVEADTVAEGVESEQQAQILRALGCTMFQGYHFHKPMAASELRDLMARSRRCSDSRIVEMA